MEKKLLTIPEISACLGLGRTKIYELLQRGEMRPVRIGRAVRVPASELERYVERLAEGQAADA